MLRVLVIRHGQSEWNALRRWQGQADPPLTDLGLHQAAHAAQHVGAVDAIVASDLERSRITAEIVAEAIGVGPVEIDPGFKERDAGEWQGLTPDEIDEAWPGYREDGRRPPALRAARAVPSPDLRRPRPGPRAGARRRRARGRPRRRRLPDRGGAGRSLRASCPTWPAAGWRPRATGPWRLGERVVLVEPGEVTVPGVAVTRAG